jgi:hypothetical protein
VSIGFLSGDLVLICSAWEGVSSVAGRVCRAMGDGAARRRQCMILGEGVQGLVGVVSPQVVEDD